MVKSRKYIYRFLIIFLTILIVSLPTPIQAISHHNLLEQKAPYFKLEGYSKLENSKNYWSSDDFLGSWLVLYFYPKDFTEGCTIEAKGFERLKGSFEHLNASIVGISQDNVDDHKSFCNGKGLGMVLLTDNEGTMSTKYQSYRDGYSLRNTYLINPEGTIKAQWNGVNPSTHPGNVLKKLQDLQS